MEIQIKGKVFKLELINGFVKFRELFKNRERWVNFPVNLVKWVSNVLNCCSNLIEFEHSIRRGHLWWKIQSGCNRWGWFLKLSIVIKGVTYSVFVPASSSVNPWNRFVNAFFHVIGHEMKQPSASYEGLCKNVNLDFIDVHKGKIESLSEVSELKLEVDALLQMENDKISPSIISNGIAENVKSSSDISCLLQDVSVEKVVSIEKEPKNSIENNVVVNGVVSVQCSSYEKSMDAGSYCLDGFVDSDGVVSDGRSMSLEPNGSNNVSIPHFQWSAKKNNGRLSQHLGVHNKSEKKNISPLLQHLGFKMEKKNGFQVAKRVLN